MIRLWFSTVFPPSSGHMAFLPRNFNLVRCLLFLSLFSHLSHTLLPLSSHIHLPHVSVFVPGCWHNTDGLGSGKDVNLRERCLLWVFVLSRGNTSCVSICLILSLLTGIYFLNSGNFSFLPIILALCIDFYLCWIRKAHSQTVSFGLCADFSVVFGRELVVL